PGDAHLEPRNRGVTGAEPGIEKAGARPPTPNPAVRRRAVDPDAAQLSAAQGRLRGGPGGRRPRGPRPLRRVDLRPRRPRRDDAAARPGRGPPEACGAPARPRP